MKAYLDDEFAQQGWPQILWPDEVIELLKMRPDEEG